MILAENTKYVAIDEIQKIPQLLEEVHRLIEEKDIKFLLTGSSARKLKRSHANMLGGRASLAHFYPLSFSEISNFDLKKYLTYGGLPRVYSSDEPKVELDSYLNTYIEQEIKLEAHIRNLAPFYRFLKTAALNNADLLNYANVANDAGVPASTVKEYYSVLEDSLIGYLLEPWIESRKRKAIQASKFYFFDLGVCHYIAGTGSLERNSDLWGKCFEQFILMELKAYISYRQKRKKVYFWRSINKQEVDFIVGDEDPIAIEVKSTKKVLPKHFSGIRALKEENLIKDYFVISEDPINRKEDNFINVIYWEDFLRKLWSDALF
jgi:predicted AAA+ superfamily ATPase